MTSLELGLPPWAGTLPLCTANCLLTLFSFPTPQGSQYWRFEDGVLDPDFPRNISEGFRGIPDNVDAALALPAHSYSGRERVYFFKGTREVGGRVRMRCRTLGLL